MPISSSILSGDFLRLISLGDRPDELGVLPNGYLGLVIDGAFLTACRKPLIEVEQSQVILGLK